MDFYSQINGDDSSLIRCADMDSLHLEDGYSIVPVIHKSWKTAEQRLLVVIETVDSLDLSNRDLLTGTTEDHGSKRDQRNYHNPMRSVLSNIPDLAVSMLRPYSIDPGEFALGVVNFNAKKIRHLDQNSQASAFPTFTKRVIAIIKRLKPTHVLVCGDTAARFLLAELPAADDSPENHAPELACQNSLYKRGWVFKRQLKGHPFLLTTTLDLESLYNPAKRQDEDTDEEEEGEDSDRYAAADLLFFVARNMANLFAGRMLHDLSHIKPRPVYVDTVEKFDAFYEKLQAAPIVATDTETKSLTNTSNAIYVAQFAMSEKRGYVIPVCHPASPFTAEESQYILKKLARFLQSKKRKIIVTFNGTFDLRIYRTQLGLDIIPYHQIHEITAGEQLLDENLGLFARIKFYFAGDYTKTSYGNLRACFAMYGNDWYFTAPFSKEERHLTGTYPPDDPNVLDYCVMDVCSIFGMAKEQIARAENQLVKPSKKSKKRRYSDFFETHLLNQMSNTVQSISHMEETGSPMDIDYLRHLAGKDSPLYKVMRETEAELHAMPNVKAANDKILRKAGKATTSLFGDDISMNVFDPNKKDHKVVLLFEIMRLKVLSLTKTKQPAINKEFTAAYRDKHQEVALLEILSKTGKLLSTYVKGWINKLEESLDSAKDFCLRPSFGFFTIVTGRLNSFKPSLQQVPSHGKLAYYIKRAFVPPPGCLNVKYDYSAHEIRGWSILSGDLAVAGSFQAGLDLRRELIQIASIPAPTGGWKEAKLDALEAQLNACDLTKASGKAKAKLLKAQIKLMGLRNDLKKKGDFHIQNVYRVWKEWVDKSSPYRDAVKKLIFGILYGKGARTLARDIDKTLEEAEEIIEKLFQEFPDGAAWLQDAVELVEKYGHVMSPIGRVRRLWRVYTGKRGVIAAAHRRAQNSPIQGFASEIGTSAAFLILRASYEFIKAQGLDPKLNMPKYCRAVHDANYFVVPFAFIIPFIHIQQYVATNGVADWYEEVFGLKFTIEPEIELEVCASEDKSYKWNWEIPSLLTDLRQSLVDLATIGRLKTKQIDSTFDLICEPWRDDAYRKELQAQFPLLNVPDLDQQILDALELFQPEPLKEAA